MNSSLKYNVTASDYIKFSRFAIQRVAKNKQDNPGNINSTLFNLILWFIIAVVFATIFQSFADNKPGLHWFSVGVGALPIFAILMAFIYNLKKIEKLCIPKEAGTVLGTKTLELSEQGITETSAVSSAFFAWECLEALTEHFGDLYLFVDKVCAVIIPANALNTAEEKQQFEETVNRYLESHKPK